jgi:hypothetical protein
MTSKMTLDQVMVGLLVAAYVLLPLDRGFPTIPIFGRPLNSAIGMTMVVFATLFVRSRGRICRYFLEPYALFQLAYWAVLVVSALRWPSPLVALHWCALYLSTFVVNYAVIRYVLADRDTDWLTKVVVTAGTGAALVGIIPSVTGIHFSMYDAWFENYFRRPPNDFALSTVRADGTMSNPILYCTLMLLVVPYALTIRTVSIRAVVLFLILLAAGLSGSRTVIPVLFVFAAGALVVWRWRAVRAWPAISAGLILLVWAVGWWVPPGQPPRAAFLVERSGLPRTPPTPKSASTPARATAGDRASGGVPAAIAAPAQTPPTPAPKSVAAEGGELGITLRIGAVVEVLREASREWTMGTWIFGRGGLTASLVGMRLKPWYNTVDNVFASVLYERGLAGLVLFVGAFGSIVYGTRRAASTSIHWYAPLALAVAGLSFCWDAYSTFNILAVGSMALVVTQENSPQRFGSGAA